MASIETAPQNALSSFFDAPGPDAELVARATALQDLIREHAAQGEEDRRIADPVITALQDAGLFHMAVPKRLGGSGANFRTFCEATSEVARADGATGWVFALLNVCTWFATLYSEEAQNEIFANPAALSRCAGIFTAPGGIFTASGGKTPERAERVDGGYIVSGEWPYASGSLHAQWSNVGIKIGENEDGTPIQGLAMIPLDDPNVSIRDTWFVAGMRGSGSNTIVAENVFIPDHRVQPFMDMAMDTYASPIDIEPNDRASFVPIAAIILVGAQVGLARAAIDLTLQKGAKKSAAYTIYPEARMAPPLQVKLAEAVSDVDAAHLLMARSCADIDRAALAGETLDPLTRARIRMDTGHVSKLCRESINKLLSVNGAASFASVNPLQRIWRNSEVASRHAFVMPEFASQIYGKVLFGDDELIQPY